MAYWTSHPFYPMVDSSVVYSSGVTHPTIRPEPVPPMLGRFSGDNAEGWILQAQLYFDFYAISDNHKLSFVSSYLDGAALEWFSWMCHNNQILNWKHFKEKLIVRFPKRTLADYMFNQPQAFLAPVSSTILNSPYSHQVFDICPHTNSPMINAFSQNNDTTLNVKNFEVNTEARMTEAKLSAFNNDEQSECSSKNGVPKALDEMSHRYKDAISFDIDSVQSNTDLETFEDLIVPNDYPYVAGASLNSRSNNWETDLEAFDDIFLDEFFLEPEIIEDLYLDIFFMENEDGSSASEMHSTDEMIATENGKVNGEVRHVVVIISIWANRISLPWFADSFIFYRPYKDCPVIIMDNSHELLRNSACYLNTTCNDHHILHQFPFDPGATIFIATPGGAVIVNRVGSEIGDSFLSLIFLQSALQTKLRALDYAKGYDMDEFLRVHSYNMRASFREISWLPNGFSTHNCFWVDTGQRLQAILFESPVPSSILYFSSGEMLAGFAESAQASKIVLASILAEVDHLISTRTIRSSGLAQIEKILSKSTILVHCFSRVAVGVLQKGAQNRKPFRFLCNEGKPGRTSLRLSFELAMLDVHARFLIHFSVAYSIDAVEIILVGADNVVSIGGDIFSMMRTCQVALVDVNMHKLVYVAVVQIARPVDLWLRELEAYRFTSGFESAGFTWKIILKEAYILAMADASAMLRVNGTDTRTKMMMIVSYLKVSFTDNVHELDMEFACTMFDIMSAFPGICALPTSGRKLWVLASAQLVSTQFRHQVFGSILALERIAIVTIIGVVFSHGETLSSRITFATLGILHSFWGLNKKRAQAMRYNTGVFTNELFNATTTIPAIKSALEDDNSVEDTVFYKRSQRKIFLESGTVLALSVTGSLNVILSNDFHHEIVDEKLLKKKARDGFEILRLVWDSRICFGLLKNDGLLAILDPKIAQFFRDSDINCVLCYWNPNIGGRSVQDLMSQNGCYFKLKDFITWVIYLSVDIGKMVSMSTTRGVKFLFTGFMNLLIPRIIYEHNHKAEVIDLKVFRVIIIPAIDQMVFRVNKFFVPSKHGVWKPMLISNVGGGMMISLTDWGQNRVAQPCGGINTFFFSRNGAPLTFGWLMNPYFVDRVHDPYMSVTVASIISALLCSNLEDKVLIEGGSIVVNLTKMEGSFGKMSNYIWDPGGCLYIEREINLLGLML